MHTYTVKITPVQAGKSWKWRVSREDGWEASGSSNTLDEATLDVQTHVSEIKNKSLMIKSSE